MSKPKTAPKPKAKRVITDDIVRTAIRLRAEGAPWSAVIEATGFNGAALRPHMARLAANEDVEANFSLNDIVGSRVAVKLDGKSIVAARKAGMPWYAISLALDTPEAKLRALAAEVDKSVATGRTYLTKPKPEPKPKAKPVKKPAAKTNKPKAKPAKKAS